MLLHLDNIPSIEMGKGWYEGAALLRTWFSRPAAIKPNYSTPDTTTITMDWALKFGRAKDVYDKLVEERIWANSLAQAAITKMLAVNKLLGNARQAFGNFAHSVPILHSNHIQHRPVKNYLYFDGMTAALADFTFRVVVAGSVEPIALPNYRVQIEKVGVYVFDSFDFEGFQPLGFWRDDPGDYDVSKFPLPGYDAVTNRTFRDWRREFSQGGDFEVFSDLRIINRSPPDTFQIVAPFGSFAPTLPTDPMVVPDDFLADYNVTGAGVMLSQISMDRYGTYHLWPLIWDENRAQIGSNPNRVPVGITLKIRKKEKYTAAQIEDAKQRSPKWASYK